MIVRIAMLLMASWLAAAALACVESEPFLQQDGAEVSLDPGAGDPGAGDPGPTDAGRDVPVACAVTSDCDDGNPCTNDLCADLLCTHWPVEEGAACSTGSRCLEKGQCVAGVCQETGVVCPPSTSQCADTTCDSQDGCTSVILKDAPCDPGDPCLDDAGTCTDSGSCAAPPRYWTWVGGDAASKERATSLRWLPDGEVLVTGWAEHSVTPGARKSRAWLLGPGGVLRHALAPATAEAGDGELFDALATPTGFVLVGRAPGPGGTVDGLVLVTDAALSVTQASHHAFGQGADDHDEGYVAVVGIGDGWAAVGTTNRDGAANNDIWVTWFDADGDVAAQQAFGGALGDFASDAIAAAGGEVAIVGSTASQGTASVSGWLLTVAPGDAIPTQQWVLSPSGPNATRALVGVAQPADGGFLVVGTDVPVDAAAGTVGDYQGYLARLEAGSAGAAWEVFAGEGSTADRFTALSRTPLAGAKGGHWIAAGQRPGPGGDVDGWLVAVSPAADQRVAWSRTYQASTGGAAAEGSFSASAVSAQGWVAAAGYVETTTLDEQAWVVAVDPWGAESCAPPCTAKAVAACVDDNPCTYDECLPGDGACYHGKEPGLFSCDIEPQ